MSKSEIARLRALARHRRARREAGRFVIEGTKLVTEVLDSELLVRRVIIARDWDSPDDLDSRIATAGAEVLQLAGHDVERIASTSSPQPVLAEVEIPASDSSALATASAVLVAVDVNDPGNVGTLARSAEAAGFDALAVFGATADPWSPKTVRAAAGALFRLSVIEHADVVEGLTALAQGGLRRLGTRMADAVPCDEADLTDRVAIIVGSEAHGLGTAYDGEIDAWVSIPMAGPTESLNVAMAGTVLAYELARQRRR